jgi:hypothetical protein
MKCRKCKEDKSIGMFVKDKRNTSGYSSICKLCSAKFGKIYRTKNIDKIKEKKDNYYRSEKGQEVARRGNLKKFGLDFNGYDALLKQQDYKCAVCGIEARKLNKNLCIDHNHTTGSVRGLLCPNCNMALGLLKDNKDNINNLLNYLL